MPAAAIAQAGRDVNAWLASGLAVHPAAKRFALAKSLAGLEIVEMPRRRHRIFILKFGTKSGR